MKHSNQVVFVRSFRVVLFHLRVFLSEISRHTFFDLNSIANLPPDCRYILRVLFPRCQVRGLRVLKNLLREKHFKPFSAAGALMIVTRWQ